MIIYKTLITIHTILAAFFLPVGLMFAITGGLYTLEITGNYHKTESRIQLQEPLPTELSALVAMAERELLQRSVAFPTGSASIIQEGTSYYFKWTGSRRDVEIHPSTHENTALLKIKETSPYRSFVQLHKAKGGGWFKAYAVVWSLGLIGLFLTGGVMAYFSRPYRKVALIAFGAGLASFVLAVWLS